MMKIRVEDRVGKAAVARQDGEDVYTEIVPLLERGDEVTLDFAGVEAFASPFFNGSLAMLVQKFDSDFLNKHLHLESLSGLGSSIARRAIDNAKEFKDPSARQRLYEILADIEKKD